MKTMIYYFTGTGNSLQAARQLASLLDNTTLRPITEQANTDPSSSAVGFVFPVYLWGAPKIVCDFIDKFKSDFSGKYLFAVATYKSQPGDVMGQLRRFIAKLGLPLSSGFVVPMPGNNIIFYDIESSQIIEDKIDASRKQLAEIAFDVSQRRKIIPRTSFPDRFLKTGLLHPVLTSTFEKADKNFWAESSCNGCAVCSQVCPTGNISIADAHPVWQHRCQQCLACIHLCPAQAIQYGKTTAGRTRYLHPGISVKDLIRRDF